MTLLATKEDKIKIVRASLRQMRSIPKTLISYEGYMHFVGDGVISPAVEGLDKNDLRYAVLQEILAASTFAQTFYKSWETVLKLSAAELYTNTVMHYVSTYGVESVFGIDTNKEDNLLCIPQGYIPEELEGEPKLWDLFVVRMSTKEEFETLLENTLYKGMALKMQTIQDYLLLAKVYDVKVDLKRVLNKECRTYLHAEMGKIPENPEETIRLLNYSLTGDTTLIQDKNRLAMAKYGWCWNSQHKEIGEKILNEAQEQLATVFYRYKKLFLAIKKAGYAKQINKIRRLANKLWQPKPEENNFLISKILSENDTVTMTELTNCETELLIKVYNKLSYIATAYREHGCYQEIYNIRNGKYFVKTKPKVITPLQYTNVTVARDTILDILIRRINPDNLSIDLPEGIDLAFPLSEKSFIGEVPIYSRIILKEKATTVGVSWAKGDIDLSGLTEDGKKVGWNSYYSNSGVVYSGDCTRGGAEALHLTEPNRIMVMVNLFNTDKNDLNLFISTQDQNGFELSRGSTFEPKEVVYTTKLHLENRSQMLGVFDNKDTSTFTFANISHGDSNVSTASELTQVMTEVLVLRGMSSLKVSDIFPQRTDENKYISLGSDKILDKSKIIALAGDYSNLVIEEEEE